MQKISNLLCTFLVLTSFFSGSLALKNANDFKSGLFKFNSIPSGIYEIEIGDQFNNQYLMAYGDFNGDKHTDMISVSIQSVPNQQQTITVNIWSTTRGVFVGSNLSTFPQCKGTIVNIIPGDINYDGKLDIVVVTKQVDNSHCLDFYYQTTCEVAGCMFESIDLSTHFSNVVMKSQPMAGDFTGQHFFQLLLFDSVKQARLIYEFQTNNVVAIVPFSDLYANDNSCQNYDTQHEFADPHFSSIVDFNGDCRSDLVLHTVQGIEFWTKADNNRFCLTDIQILKRDGASLVSFNFSDINYDGSVDMVALIRENAVYRLVILYNKSTVSASNLCSKFKQSPHYDLISAPSSYQTETIDVYSNVKGIFPIQIRFSDIDWDGRPDIVITKSIAGKNYGAPLVLMNSSCDGDDCSQLSVSNKRQFGASTSSNYSNMYQVETINVSFFDINEDGKIDFMIHTFENGKYGVRCFFNYISTDAFFLKALGLNGQCTTSSCQSSIYYGSTYQCKVTTLDTTYKTATGVQLTQSAYGALQLPFVILGLSRTNNYIENFTVGLPQPDADDSSRYWTPIIPNSQLIIFPHTLATSNWEISIFVQPNDALIIVIIVTIAILVLLGGIIIYYHRKEKIEEQQNQQEFLKMIR